MVGTVGSGAREGRGDDWGKGKGMLAWVSLVHVWGLQRNA